MSRAVKPHFRQSSSSPTVSLDSQLAEILRASGGVENLREIVSAIQKYIEGELLETELGQILRKRWPRGR